MARDHGFKVKVAMIGPCESGKTMLCNFLADATENTIEEYQPTKVVRIVEYETVIYQFLRKL
jgi:Rab-like protein 5